MNKISKTFSELEQKYKREPSPEELAEVLELSENEVVDVLKFANKHISVDAPFNSEDSNSLLDVLYDAEEDAPDNELLSESLKKEVSRTLRTLPEKEASIVILYFGLGGKHPMTLEEIGEKLDLTRERVRQVKEKAIKKLRHASRTKTLKHYLG